MGDTPIRTDPAHQSDADYEEASRSTADFVQNIKPMQERKRKTRRLRIIVGVILALVLVGAGGYFLFLRERPTNVTPQQQPADQTTPETASVPLKTHSSDAQNLSFDYPGDWRVTKDAETRLTLESPGFKVLDTGGQELDAKVVLTILPDSTSMDEFDIGQGEAALASEKFTYDQPTQNQREETFLSFVRFSTAAQQGIDAVYITGNNGYEKNAPVPKADFKGVAPVVRVTFEDNSDTRLTIADNEWAANKRLRDVFAILKSLKLQ